MNLKHYLTLMAAPVVAGLLGACASDDVSDENVPQTQGQTLTINASNEGNNGGATRTIYGLETGGNYEVITAKWDKANDKVVVFGSSNATNKAMFSVKDLSTDGTAATLEGTLPTALNDGDMVNAYIVNDDVVSVNSDAQLEVDYSEQDGTWQDAVKHSLLYGSATYSSADGNVIPEMKFAYKTAFFKLTLDFNDASINSKASLCMTGDKLLSLSRINTVYNKGGGTNKVVDGGSINIPNATIENGKATIYIALYPQVISNVRIQAQLENGKIYIFKVSPEGKPATISNGFFYQFGCIAESDTYDTNALPSSFKGSGTEEDPYQISSVVDLMKLQKDVLAQNYSKSYFKMTSDITINGNWTPIGDNSKMFCGNFDGDNHSILGNINVENLAGNSGAGLFGVVGPGCVIRNLTNKANIKVAKAESMSTWVGGIAGRARKNASFINCANIGNITAPAGAVGGIVGEFWTDLGNNTEEVRVEACYNNGDITSTAIGTKNSSNFVGGIVGHVNLKNAVDRVVVVGCYNGNVIVANNSDANYSYVGGIVGCTNGSQTEATNLIVKACWNSSQDFAGRYIGCIAGSSSKSIFTVTTCWTKGNKYPISNGTASTLIDNFNGKGTVSNELVDLKSCISKMNSAWGSKDYRFDENGNIVNN